MTPDDARWLRSHPLVFVGDIDAPVLDEEDHRHLSRSLRMDTGDPLSIGDGAGRWRRARFGPISEPVGDVIEVAPSPWPVTVAFAPVKSHKPEWVLQKLTELGVDHLAVIETERSVVKWDDGRANRRRDRIARAIHEAAMQSRQVRLPSFEPMMPLGEFLDAHPDSALAEPNGSPIGPGDRILLIGPEGGWSPRERSGLPLRRLPGGVLRAETACIVAGALLVHARG